MLPAYFFSSVSLIMLFRCLGIYKRPRDPINQIDSYFHQTGLQKLFTNELPLNYCCSFLMFPNMTIPIQSGRLYILPLLTHTLAHTISNTVPSQCFLLLLLLIFLYIFPTLRVIMRHKLGLSGKIQDMYLSLLQTVLPSCTN